MKYNELMEMSEEEIIDLLDKEGTVSSKKGYNLMKRLLQFVISEDKPHD